LDAIFLPQKVFIFYYHSLKDMAIEELIFEDLYVKELIIIKKFANL